MLVQVLKEGLHWTEKELAMVFVVVMVVAVVVEEELRNLLAQLLVTRRAGRDIG